MNREESLRLLDKYQNQKFALSFFGLVPEIAELALLYDIFAPNSKHVSGDSALQTKLTLLGLTGITTYVLAKEWTLFIESIILKTRIELDKNSYISDTEEMFEKKMDSIKSMRDVNIEGNSILESLIMLRDSIKAEGGLGVVTYYKMYDKRKKIEMAHSKKRVPTYIVKE